jgi:drug/metabolite transporter (DMT)-like permease
MNNIKGKACVLLGVLSLIWGTSFILIKKGLIAFSPIQVGSLRILISGIVFLPYVLFNIKKVKMNKWKYILLFALLEVGIPPYLFAIAQTAVDSSTAGILNSLVPLFTLFTGIMFFRLSFNISKLSGVLIGLMGAVFLIFTRASLHDGPGFAVDFSNMYGLLILLATLLYGFGTNLLKAYLQDVPGLLISAFSFVSMSIPAGIILLTTNIFEMDLTTGQNLNSFLAVLTLSIAGSAIAIYLYSVIVQESSALFASFVTYFIPFVSLMWGYLDKEPLNIMQFFSLACILAGIYLTNKGETRRKENQARRA